MKLVMNYVVAADSDTDVLEYGIHYHARQGVTHFGVACHHRNPGEPTPTADLLADLSKKFEITTWHMRTPEFMQHQWMTSLGEAAASAGADWIVNSDADEFWMAVNNQGLPQALSGIPADVESLQCMWRTVAPCADLPWQKNPYVKTGDTMYKTIMRPHPGISVSAGNHWVYSSKRPWQYPPIVVYHYTDRSFEAIAKKYTIGHTALAASGVPEWVGGHWRNGATTIAEKGIRLFVDSIMRPAAVLEEDPSIIKDYAMVNALESLGLSSEAR